MTEFMHRDRLRDLWMQINQLHLSYLQADETSCKIEQRNKLESYIKEYLCIVPHDRKFCFRETAEVLHRSASSKDDFSAYRAACAWKAIGMYAANLLSQPWRKEYREMKTYCGFYKHEIEANLVGAEMMLEAMGYKRTDHTTMVLDGPIDPDRVSNVSRDSLMAAVECQLLKAIWEEVSRRFHCGWLEVLEFRENHVGTPENAARGLVYHFHQRQYQEQQQQQLVTYHHQGQAIDNYGTAARFHQAASGCLYGQVPSLSSVPHMGYYNYSPYAMGHPHAYTLPSQPRYGAVMSPQQALPPAMPYPVPTPVHPPYLTAPVHPVIKSQDLYSTASHNTIHQYQPQMTIAPQPMQGMQMAVQNGYTAPNQISVATVPATIQNYNCPVPTGQLIELDAAPPPPPSRGSETQQTYSATDSSSSVLIPRTIRQHHTHQLKKNSTEKQYESYNRNPLPVENPQSRNYDVTRSEIQQPSLSSKTKDEGTGTFGSWDYVFRNLESQGYNKDLGERPDVLSPPFDSNSKNHKSDTRENRHPRQQQTEVLDLEGQLMEMRLEEFHRKMMLSSNEHRTMKINEALEKIGLEDDADMPRTHLKPTGNCDVDGNISVYDNMSSPPKETSVRQRPHALTLGLNISNGGSMKLSAKTLPREPRKQVTENKRFVHNNPHYSSATLDPRQLADRGNHSGVGNVTVGANEIANEKHRDLCNRSRSNEKPVERKENDMDLPAMKDAEKSSGSVLESCKWECVFCTFLNDPPREVCEMCGKSKTKGSESQPLASGGRECPKCTLVNEKGMVTCGVCGCSLKDSPTYI